MSPPTGLLPIGLRDALCFMLLVACLYGCQITERTAGHGQPSQVGTGLQLPKSLDLARLVNFTEEIYAATPEEIEPLVGAAKRNLDQEPSTLNAVSYALILSVPGTPHSDLASSMARLQELLVNEAGQTNEFSQFLRLQLVYARVRQQLIRTGEEKLMSERRRRAVLERQLDELKRIETHLNQRDEPRR